MKRRGLRSEVRVEPTTDMVGVWGACDCTGDAGRVADGVCEALRKGSETEVMTMCGRLYVSWSTSMARSRDAESVILTPERSLHSARVYGVSVWLADGEEDGYDGKTHSASNWLGSIRSAW